MQKDIEYIKSSFKFILVVTGIFSISFAAGFVIPLEGLGLSENYFEMLKRSLGWIKELPPVGIMLVIFLNNALKSLMAIVLGAGFGLVPVLFVAGNGMILGLLVNLVSREQGSLYVMAAILPHGIIELPMILISAGLGLRLGYLLYISVMGEKTDMRYELKESLRTYLRIIMPLLFVSAIVETFVTPFIVLSVSH